MDVAGVISRVRVLAGDTTSLQFTDAQVITWINDGIRECAVDNNLLQKRATQNSVIGTAAYNMPVDILKLHSIKYDGRRIPVKSLQEFEEEVTISTDVTQGEPITSYIWANKINLYPVPGSVKSLVIDYTYDPALITVGADPLPLPVGYHSRLVDYCLAQVYLQDDNNNMYLTKLDEFRTGVQSLRDQSESSQDLYPSISPSARDMGSWEADYYG